MRFETEKQGPWEKRTNIRKRCKRSTEFVVDNLPYCGTMKNISIEGVFIETRESFPVGQTIQVKFQSSKDGAEIKLRGEVVRNDDSGIGIRFLV